MSLSLVFQKSVGHRHTYRYRVLRNKLAHGLQKGFLGCQYARIAERNAAGVRVDRLTNYNQRTTTQIAF